MSRGSERPKRGVSQRVETIDVMVTDQGSRNVSSLTAAVKLNHIPFPRIPKKPSISFIRFLAIEKEMIARMNAS